MMGSLLKSRNDPPSIYCLRIRLQSLLQSSRSWSWGYTVDQKSLAVPLLPHARHRGGCSGASIRSSVMVLRCRYCRVRQSLASRGIGSITFAPLRTAYQAVQPLTLVNFLDPLQFPRSGVSRHIYCSTRIPLSSHPCACSLMISRLLRSDLNISLGLSQVKAKRLALRCRVTSTTW